MTSASAATIIAGALGLAGVLIGIWANVRIKRRESRATAEATIARYREPLVGAAFELQARIYNIGTGRFFGEDWSSYHVDHTLYVFAQYLGWREIIRLEIQFMDLGDAPETKKLAELLEQVTSAISVTKCCVSPTFKLFRGEQRAIGENMMVSTSTATQASLGHRCLGYASFVKALNQSNFNVWFEKLITSINDLKSADTCDLSRLSLLQNALIDLIEFLDPDCVRFPKHLRNRMEMKPKVEALRSQWSTGLGLAKP